LGNFLEHLVGAQNPKGLKTLFKTIQPPAKTNPNNQQSNAVTVPEWTCAVNPRRKNEKNERTWEKWVFGEKMGEKPKVGRMGGRRWVG
jgi:hypothetical protein